MAACPAAGRRARESLWLFSPRIWYAGGVWRNFFQCSLLILFVSGHAPAAQEGNLTLAAGSRESAVVAEPLSLPSPGEFFAAIEKTGRPNWSLAGRAPFNPALDQRPQIALGLGILVTDGYLAVENQDGQAVKNIGRDIIALAKKLNVSEGVVARGNSITDFAERNDWNTLKEELEATQNDVKQHLADQKDDDLLTLITAGAWLRGVQAVADLQTRNYQPAGASLLHQPYVAAYLVESLDALPEKIRTNPGVAATRVAMESIGSSLELTPDASVTPEVVGKISQSTTAALEAVTGLPVTPAPEPTPES